MLKKALDHRRCTYDIPCPLHQLAPKIHSHLFDKPTIKIDFSQSTPEARSNRQKASRPSVSALFLFLSHSRALPKTPIA